MGVVWEVAMLLPVPEGHRRKLAGGKAAPADAAPGRSHEITMPQRGIEEPFPNSLGELRHSQFVAPGPCRR